MNGRSRTPRVRIRTPRVRIRTPRVRIRTPRVRIRTRCGAAGAAAAALLLVAGCATVPVRPAAQWLGALPDNATLYVSLDVERSVDVLRAALERAGPESREVGPMLERTDRLYAAVERADPSSPARLSLVALGSYPAGLIRSRLCSSRSWETVKSSAGTYYVSAKAGVQVGVPKGYAVLVSTGAIETLLARFAAPVAPPLPAEVAEGMERADMVLYLPELPGGLPGAPGGAALPIREVWLDVRRTADRYDVAGTCNTATERDARSLVLLARLALVAWMRAQNLPDPIERLKTVTVTSEGAQVKLAGLSFAKDELVPVLLSLAGMTAPGGWEAAPGAGAGTGGAGT
jgi:hypothetical protein